MELRVKLKANDILSIINAIQNEAYTQKEFEAYQKTCDMWYEQKCKKKEQEEWYSVELRFDCKQVQITKSGIVRVKL